MSRTFRHRHLPVVSDNRFRSGGAFKILDGNAGWNYFRKQEYIQQRMEAEYGPRPDWRTNRLGNWQWEQLQNQMEHETIWPTANWHPWQRHSHYGD